MYLDNRQYLLTGFEKYQINVRCISRYFGIKRYYRLDIAILVALIGEEWVLIVISQQGEDGKVRLAEIDSHFERSVGTCLEPLSPERTQSTPMAQREKVISRRTHLVLFHNNMEH